MNSAKSLSDEQISSIRAWAEEGDGLPEIQKKLREECNLRFTYLETRFLIEDLKIELKSTPVPEPEPEPKAEEEEAEEAEPGQAAGDAAPDTGEAASDGGVRVSLDKVLRPGAIISGKVDFGGGNSASWWLDQMGRLGFDPGSSNFEPTEAQMISFQSELRAVIQKSGL